MSLASGYDPQHVLNAVDQHTFWVMFFMSLCLVSAFVYLVSAFRTAFQHRSYPAPLAAVGFFAVHDLSFVLHWNRWFDHYHNWWLEAWCISLIGTSAIEFALVFLIYKFGREDLMPRLSQREFGVALVGAMIAIAVVWAVIKNILNDDLYLTAFAVTAWMPPVFSTVLLCGRGSMRGQTMLMNWVLVTNPIGMFGAWMFLDSYFRSPLYIAFGAVTVGWALFNVWVMSKYPRYIPPASDAGYAARPSITSLDGTPTRTETNAAQA